MLVQGLSRCVKHLCPMNTAALRGRDAFQQAKRLRAAAREPSSLASDDAYSRQRRRGGRIIIRATRRRRPALRVHSGRVRVSDGCPDLFGALARRPLGQNPHLGRISLRFGGHEKSLVSPTAHHQVSRSARATCSGRAKTRYDLATRRLRPVQGSDPAGDWLRKDRVRRRIRPATSPGSNTRC